MKPKAEDFVRSIIQA